MIHRKNICFIIWILCFVLTQSLHAKDEQWLRYHMAREVRLVGISPRINSLQLLKIIPEDVNVPEFKSDQPYFFKWITPMVPAGHLWMAFDRSTTNGPYNRLYIDSNANNNLDDESVITAYRSDQYLTNFGPVKVIFQIEDGPVTYHLNLGFYAYQKNTPMVHFTSGGWYQGEITINDDKKLVTLFDYNANGTFNDKSLNGENSDRICIGDQPGSRYVGRYIDINDVLYEPEIARDGAYIKLTQADNIEKGNVRVPETVTELQVGGENGSFILKPEKGLAELPIGQYRVIEWTHEQKDEQETLWRLKGTCISRNEQTVTVTANTPVELPIGEPVISSLNASSKEGTYSFSYTMQGRNTERIELTRNGSRPRAPKLQIKNKDGTYDRTYPFQYG